MRIGRIISMLGVCVGAAGLDFRPSQGIALDMHMGSNWIDWQASENKQHAQLDRHPAAHCQSPITQLADLGSL